MTSQSSCHVSSRIQHCDNNKTTDGQRLSRDPSENCGRKAPSGIKSNSATTMPQQQPCEMWMTKNGFMMKCMDQNNSRRTLMITYHLPLHTHSPLLFTHAATVGWLGLYSDVSKIGNLILPGRQINGHDEISGWLKFQPNRTTGRTPPSQFCVTK